jgi:hypothetical protein
MIISASANRVMYSLSRPEHPLPSGSILHSPGTQFRYRIIGPCCRLFDREQLPWPCCRLQWHSKEPSWRRVGPRFVPDMSTKRSPSYSVELVGYEASTPITLTLYTVRFTAEQQDWWYRRHRPALDEKPTDPLSLKLISADP